MALDHYISQVHLKNFADVSLGAKGNHLRAIRKADMFKFTPRSQDVCRIENGSTNDYLTEPRLVEKWLKEIENNYNRTLESIDRRQISSKELKVICSYISYIQTCTPAGMRLHSKYLSKLVETSAYVMDKQGLFSDSPKFPNDMSVTELFSQKIVKVDVDGKYPQSIGIVTLERGAEDISQHNIEFLINPEPLQNPFITSDYPVAIEPGDSRFVLNKLFPLSTKIAVKFIPTRSVSRYFRKIYGSEQASVRIASRNEVVNLNRLIAQSAETTVFYNSDLSWIENLVQKYRDWRMDIDVGSVPIGDNYALPFRYYMSDGND